MRWPAQWGNLPTVRACCLSSLFIFALFIVGCSQSSPPLDLQTNTLLETPTGAGHSLNLVPVQAQPLEEVASQFHPDARQFMEETRVTVPPSLPPLAFAAFTAVNPQLSSYQTQLNLVEITEDGYAEFPVVQANVGSNPFQPNVLCLRNGQQISCAPGADVWQLFLPPETAAPMNVHIPADKGDQITLLFLPDRETARIQLGANIKWVHVQERANIPATALDAPAHPKLYEGCDFVTLIKDPEATDPLNFNLYTGVERGDTVYLLIQLCTPTGNEYIQLAPVADRTSVVDIPIDLWRSTIRLHSAAHLIPVPTSYFGQAQEFQIALIPLSDEAKLAFRRKSFTQAVLLR